MGIRTLTFSLLIVFSAAITQKLKTCPEYKARAEIIEKLNVYESLRFELMWTTDISEAFYSPPRKIGEKIYPPYTLVFYKSRAEGARSYKEKMNSSMPVFQYGGIQAWLPYGDWNNLREKVRTIMVGMGFEIR